MSYDKNRKYKEDKKEVLQLLIKPTEIYTLGHLKRRFLYT